MLTTYLVKIMAVRDKSLYRYNGFTVFILTIHTILLHNVFVLNFEQVHLTIRLWAKKCRVSGK